MRFLLVIGLVMAAVILCSQPAVREQVGPLPDGGFLLNSGWKIHPAGKIVPLDTLPMSVALSKDGKYLLVLNAGYQPPSVSVLDVASANEISRVRVPDGWLGLTFAPNGKFVYVGGGSEASVYEFSFADGKLTPSRVFPIVPEAQRTWQDFIGDVAVSPDGRLIYAASLYRNTIVVINPQSGMVIENFKTGRRPYRILFHPDGKSFFVTSWADGMLYQQSADDGSLLSVTRVGAHPTDMAWSGLKVEAPPGDAAPPWKARLMVAAANTNNVYVFGVSESKELQMIETINVALTPQQPAGSTPSALALSPDQKRLFIACSDINAVAVADVSEDRSEVLGFIPTGWYPTAVKALSDGRLVVLNGRGVRSFPNPGGPNPFRKTAPVDAGGGEVEYVARIQRGSASFIAPFDDAALAGYSDAVLRNSPYRDAKLDAPVSGLPKNIEHVIYIVKENRTYDQVFGDEKRGNGDPSLVLFSERVAPNHRKLAREFVLLDNFYVNADVSADGHNWSEAAIAPDYVQKLWPNSYARRRKHNDYHEEDVASLPPAGYLWTNAVAAGISLRNYGHMVDNTAQPEAGGIQVHSVRDPVLRPVTNLRYRGFDLNYSDVERAKVFLGDLAEFEKSGMMPKLIVMRLGNDHTSGTSPGKIAPLSSFADNDYALGMIVEGVSRSHFWPKTAIFVLEDDAQNGPDHVDSHRSPAFVLSPYTRRGVVDSTMYNTTSMLRTMEVMLGMRPMTVFDGGARVMSSVFSPAPDPRPYECEKPRISLDERNKATSATAARSAKLDFDDADCADDDALNAILWTAIRGSDAPPPVRSFFAR